MSFSSGPVLTNAGAALLARVQAGSTLTFTKMQLGDGSLGTAALSALTALVNPVITLPVGTKAAGQYCKVTARYSNSMTEKFTGDGSKTAFALSAAVSAVTSAKIDGVLTSNFTVSGGLMTFAAAPAAGAEIVAVYAVPAFYWREIGIFAADPDHPSDRSYDILYCVQNAGALAEYIPATSSELITRKITIACVIGNATNVTITMSGEIDAGDIGFDAGASGMESADVGSAILEVVLAMADKQDWTQLLDAPQESTTLQDADLVPVYSSVEAKNTKWTLQKLHSWIKSKTDKLYAALEHAHGNITKDGKIGAVAGKLVKTGTGGALVAVDGITEVAITLTAAGWSGAAEPYTQTVTVAGVTAGSKGDFAISGEATAAQREAWRDGCILLTAQATNQITVTADGDKPGVDLPGVVRLFH